MPSSTAAKTAAVNLNLLMAFVDVLQTDALEVAFPLVSFNIPTFYNWVMERDTSEVLHIMSLPTEKDARRAPDQPPDQPVGIPAH